MKGAENSLDEVSRARGRSSDGQETRQSVQESSSATGDDGDR